MHPSSNFGGGAGKFTYKRKIIDSIEIKLNHYIDIKSGCFNHHQGYTNNETGPSK